MFNFKNGNEHDATLKAPVVSLRITRDPYCLVLVGFRNRFERDFRIELKQLNGIMKY